MLTVLFKGLHEEEVLFQTDQVISGKFSKESKFADRPYCEFWNKNGDKAHDLIQYGNIYVMNENGKTVAHYHLGGHDLAGVPPCNPHIEEKK